MRENADVTDTDVLGAAPPSATTIALVAAGGVVGATGRWLVGAAFDHEPGTFPWATLAVNVVGALLIGIAASRLQRATPVWSFSVTGLLGGFTTMSAFAVELNDLVDADRTALATIYLAVTLAAGLAAHLVGGKVGKGPGSGDGALLGAGR